VVELAGAGSSTPVSGGATVASFLVETYVPDAQARDARLAGRRMRAAVRKLSREGTSIRYVRTTLLPGDETCFHVLAADSRDAVAAACRLAGLERARIVDAVE
jgi:hypothetical protein